MQKKTSSLKSIQKLFRSHLNVTPAESDFLFYSLTKKNLKISGVDLALNPDLKVEQEQIEILLSNLEELKAEKPLQYILEEVQFCDLLLKVNQNVLIPRPETEELTRWIIASLKKTPRLNILDIGTGSGCIALALCHHLKPKNTVAIDISKKALYIAKYNSVKLNLNIHFEEMDILKKNHLTQKFDLIVSNPPYVKKSEKEMMHNNVLCFEPKNAIFVEDSDPLIFYDKILGFSQNQLSKGGYLFFEINPLCIAELEKNILKYNYLNYEFRQDSFGNMRFLKIMF